MIFPLPPLAVTAALQAGCYNGRRMRTAAPELMDDPACAERELRAALRDLGRINGRFGAHAFVSRYLDRALPDDVKRAVAPVLRHRVMLKPEAELEGFDADRVLADVIAGVPVPRQ